MTKNKTLAPSEAFYLLTVTNKFKNPKLIEDDSGVWLQDDNEKILIKNISINWPNEKVKVFPVPMAVYSGIISSTNGTIFNTTFSGASNYRITIWINKNKPLIFTKWQFNKMIKWQTCHKPEGPYKAVYEMGGYLFSLQEIERVWKEFENFIQNTYEPLEETDAD